MVGAVLANRTEQHRRECARPLPTTRGSAPSAASSSTAAGCPSRTLSAMATSGCSARTGRTTASSMDRAPFSRSALSAAVVQPKPAGYCQAVITCRAAPIGCASSAAHRSACREASSRRPRSPLVRTPVRRSSGSFAPVGHDPGHILRALAVSARRRRGLHLRSGGAAGAVGVVRRRRLDRHGHGGRQRGATCTGPRPIRLGHRRLRQQATVPRSGPPILPTCPEHRCAAGRGARTGTRRLPRHRDAADLSAVPSRPT